MCTPKQISGKCVPAMAQAIISMCSRTWSQERRISVLLRTIEPPLSVWDCVPEQIIDAQLKDAFDYLPEQRDYILFYAIPGSAVVRSIRRLDGHRATPLVLKSLHFAKEEDIDAYNFPQELSSTPDFWDCDYGEDSTISRESTRSPTSVSEFDDDNIRTATQDGASESGDEEIRGKPQQWTDYSESEDVVVCTTPQQSASDLDDKAFSPEQQLSPVYQTHPEIDDEHQDDESLEAKILEPRELFTIDECDKEFDDDHQNDESLEAKIPEPQERFTIDECDEEFDDGQQDDEPLEANSPEPQNLSPIHRSDAEFDDDQKDHELPEVDSPEARRLFSVRHESPVLEFDDDEMDNELQEGDSPEPRRLFPVHRSHSALYDPPQEAAEEMKPYCMAPLRRFLTPQSQLDFDLFEEWFVYMSENASINANPQRSLSERSSPEPRRLFPLQHESPIAEYDDVEYYDEPIEAEDIASRQFYLTSYDPPQPPPKLEIFCPRPIREHPTHKVILQPELFEDWHVDMSEPVFIDEKAMSLEQFVPFPFRQESPVLEYDDVEDYDEPIEAEDIASRQFYLTSYAPPQPPPKLEIFCPRPIREHPTHKVILQPELFEDWHVDMSEPVFVDEKAMSPEQFVPFPFRQESPVLEYDDDENCDEPIEAEDIASRQSYLTSYAPPQPPPKLEIFCPRPIRPTHKMIVKPELFEDLHVDMSDPVPVDEKSMSSEQSVPSETLCDEKDDEVLESFEYIPLESLNLGF